SAHLLDDRARVGDEDLRIVLVARLVEQARGARHGRLEARRIDLDAVRRAERLVAFAAEDGPGADQREVDVEEDGPRRHRPRSVAAGTAAGLAVLVRP